MATKREFLPLSALTVLKLLVCAGAAWVLAERVWIMTSLPLWLDETWSAMIATQPTFGIFWREAWLDCNPPLYYAILALWTGLVGGSDLALRLPSLIFTTAAALVALAGSPKSIGALGRWTWAATILFWMNSLTLSTDARGYGLLLLLATAATVVFAELYRQLSFRQALLWVALCDLMFLTHYYAALLILTQGILLLHRHGLRLVTVWPAALLGLPPLLWFGAHLPRLRDYARPDVAWYDVVDGDNVLTFVKYVVGNQSPAFLLMIALVLGTGLAFKLQPGDDDPGPAPRAPGLDPAWAAALAGVAAFAIALVVGMLRASLAPRYLIPTVPPIMLCFVLLALQSPKRGLICVLLAGAYLSTSLNIIKLRDFSVNHNTYGYERGSGFIARGNPSEIVFAWDHPAAKILDHESLRKMGGFFLHRAGIDVPTRALVLDEHEDPNVTMPSAATSKRPAIIWLYNTNRQSAARTHAPALDADPRWLCRHDVQRSGRIGALACIKRDASHV